MPPERKHRVSVIVEGQQIDGWINYAISSSMIEPSDAFSMKRPWSRDAWRTLRLDAQIRVTIDGVTVLRGLIDRRRKSVREDVIEIGGRDWAGRLVQESAMSLNYSNLTMVEAIRRLADPWFTKITLSDARNRSVRRGKGRRVPAGDEPIVLNTKVPKRGKVSPGALRWAVIEDIVSASGLICWSSADGRELFVGRPNHTQAPQFLIHHARPGSSSRGTCMDLDFVEDNGDRYSYIGVVGTSPGSDANYGANVTSRAGRAVDNEEGTFGTGRDFLYPKRLLMPEANFEANGDAKRVAEREMWRRDFRARSSTARMPGHGQFISTTQPTLFAPNTVARVVDEDFEPPADDNWMIHTVNYEADGESGETTSIEMVPVGTEIVL